MAYKIGARLFENWPVYAVVLLWLRIENFVKKIRNKTRTAIEKKTEQTANLYERIMRRTQ